MYVCCVCVCMYVLTYVQMPDIVLFEARFIFTLHRFCAGQLMWDLFLCPYLPPLAPTVRFWAASGSQGIFRTVTGQVKAGRSGFSLKEERCNSINILL